MMISNCKNPFGLHGLNKNNLALVKTLVHNYIDHTAHGSDFGNKYDKYNI